MTEDSSKPDIVRKIKSLNHDEEQNYFIVEELDEIENPLELDQSGYVDFDVSMDDTYDHGNSSDDGNNTFPMGSSPAPENQNSSSKTMTIIRRTWDYGETKEMLAVFVENKRYIDRLMKVKDKYEFIAKKLNDRNPDQLINGTAIENKIKALIRTYRANSGRKYAGKSVIDRYLEEIFGGGRLMKRDEVKTEVFKKSFETVEKSSGPFNPQIRLGKDESINIGSTSIRPASVEGPSAPKKMKILKHTDSQTPQTRRQAQATQTDLGDNMIMQLVQIEKNQQKRWEEEKALIARIERAKAERSARKESFLQELVNVLKTKLQ